MVSRRCWSMLGSSRAAPALLVVLASAALLLHMPVAAVPSPAGLRFRPDNTFVISLLTDLHYGEGDAKDANTSRLVAGVLEAERPDLAVLGGDTVSGFACTMIELQASVMTAYNKQPYQSGPGSATGICPEGWYEGVWSRVITPLQAAGVPYASILGNHDDEGDISDRSNLLAVDISTGNGLSLTQQGPDNIPGASNYYLDVQSPDGRELAARLWFLDSMDRGCEGEQGSGCVSPDTVQWLEDQAATLPRVPSIAFVHIPIQQFMSVWRAGSDVVGSALERSECQAVDTGLFSAAKNAGIGAIYSGHVHDSTFSGIVDGIRLAHGVKTGYGSYGPNGFARGARIIQLTLGNDTAHSPTWIRQEDGTWLEQAPPSQAARAQNQQDSCLTESPFCQLFPVARSCIVERMIVQAGGPGFQYDPWFLCKTPLQPFDVNTAVLMVELSLTSTVAGFALTMGVQSWVSLEARKQLIVLAHLVAAFVWMLPMLTCSPWTFPLLVGSLFLWGSEPYDNILSPEFWRLINTASGSAKGSPRWLHYYWAVSCPLVHFWFLTGAGAVVVGIYRPIWWTAAVPCFWLSHAARICSYSHRDRIASALEALGVAGLAGCLAWSVLDEEPVWVMVWLAVMLTERASHLPAALRCDASWMRSYELWEGLLREAGHGASASSDDDASSCAAGGRHGKAGAASLTVSTSAGSASKSSKPADSDSLNGWDPNMAV